MYNDVKSMNEFLVRIRIINDNFLYNIKSKLN